MADNTGKKGFSASGRTTVNKFETMFEEIFGVTCDVLDSNNELADNSATLASLRPEDFNGPKKIDFELRGNMLIKNVRKKFEESFGTGLTIYSSPGTPAPQDNTLASIKNTDTSFEEIKDIFFDFEDILMEKSVLVGIAPSSMVGVSLAPEFYTDDDEKKMKCTITVECSEDEEVDEDTLEEISDVTNDYLTESGLFNMLEKYNITDDVLDWWPVKIEEV